MSFWSFLEAYLGDILIILLFGYSQLFGKKKLTTEELKVIQEEKKKKKIAKYETKAQKLLDLLEEEKKEGE